VKKEILYIRDDFRDPTRIVIIEQNASDTNQPITSKKYEENHKTISELATHKLARTEY
jgi:hypothetical protein